MSDQVSGEAQGDFAADAKVRAAFGSGVSHSCTCSSGDGCCCGADCACSPCDCSGSSCLCG